MGDIEEKNNNKRLKKLEEINDREKYNANLRKVEHEEINKKNSKHTLKLKQQA